MPGRDSVLPAFLVGTCCFIMFAAGCEEGDHATDEHVPAMSLRSSDDAGDRELEPSPRAASDPAESRSPLSPPQSLDDPLDLPQGPEFRAGLPTDREGHTHTNRLINETSPYLLQHAHNPVDWYPWGEEAFERAKAEDKPVFLSVGYSTCYWCHVMERESFENERVAELLNEHFIAIKLDREERPDVDEQYMLATQLTTGRGGWPNSVWMTPDGRPFMAGTYFSRNRFMQILRQVTAAWQSRREQIEQQADELAERISGIGSGSFAATLRPINQQLITQVKRQLTRTYDQTYGGFGTRPRFPPHGRLRLLAELYRSTNDPELLTLITGTLDAMALGGMHDHIGGGFHRYATDQRWFLPHFEKMLYDNAQLMRAYADGYALADESRKHRYAEVIDHIYFWLQREMTDPERGVFYSAIDAEVDAVEGQNVVWYTDEVIEVLGEERGRLFADVYGFEDRGNYTEESSGHRPGNNLPYLRAYLDQIATRRGVDAAAFQQEIAQMRMELLAVRDERKQPLRDDKILTSWNALMIEALAYAGRQLDDSRYIEAAVRAAYGLLDLMHDDEHLLRVYRDGRAHTPGYLDDHAYLALALLELYEATGDARWLQESQRLANVMLEQFEDKEDGAFFFSAPHHDQLILRSKGLTGGGNVPSGNGIAVRTLYRMAELTGEDRYRAAARRTLESLSGLIWRSIHGNEDLLLAVAKHYVDSVPAVARRDNAPNRPRSDRTSSRSSDPNAIDADPDAHHDGHPIAIAAYTSRLSARPGETVLIAVALEMADGWHLYGPNRGLDLVQPTEVRISPSDAWQVRSMTTPEVKRKYDAFFDRELETYSGRIWYLAPVFIKQDANAGETTLSIDVLTQTCDHSRCLPPRTDTLEIAFNIDPNATAGTLRHRELFTALRSR